MIPKITKDRPFTLELFETDRTLRAWPDKSAPGGVQVVIDCQSHGIQEWRDSGLEIIAVNQLLQGALLSADQFIGLFVGDTARTAENLVQRVEEIKKKHPAVMQEATVLYYGLLKTLDYVQDMIVLINALHEKAAEKPRQRKTKRK